MKTGPSSFLPNILLSALVTLWLADLNAFSITILFFIVSLFFVSFFRHVGLLLGMMIFFDFIQEVYRGYAGKEIEATDIYLFFTHIGDVAESGMLVEEIIWRYLPGVLLVLIASAILLRLRSVVKAEGRVRFIVVLLWIPLMGWAADAGRLVAAAADASYILAAGERGPSARQETIRCQKKPSDRDVVVILGESLRYDPAYFKGMDVTVRPVFSGATNTDTSLPLFFNGVRQLPDLRKKSPYNLFYLAKENGFATAFISAQSAGNLKYIRPYLYPEAIDYLKTYEREMLGELFDGVLLDELRRWDRKKKSLIVLQMVGEHSPYRFYPDSFAPYSSEQSAEKRVAEDYGNSVAFTRSILEKILDELKKSSRDYTVFFTSDHGELLGREFGHNQFREEIYRVPSFVSGSGMAAKEVVTSHHDLYRLVRRGLGWQCEAESGGGTYINGTMLSGEDGYLEVTQGKDGSSTVSEKRFW